MKLEEIMPHLRQGRKARLNFWFIGTYIKIADNNLRLFIDERIQDNKPIFYGEEILSNNWEIIE